MNIALIIAGGCGKRMNQDIPKQFLNVNDKPVLLYTLEAFQKHPNIDAIVVVCLEGWHEILKAYCKQFNISKVVSIINGGENGQDSIKKGIIEISSKYNNEDLVLVHDGIRPLVSEEIISDCIVKCKECGSAIAAIPCAEAMLETADKIMAKNSFDREKLMRTQTPQAFKLEKLIWAHDEAKKRGITNSVASCTLMIELGEKVYFSLGSEKNIKLTTTSDLDIFKALLDVKKSSWIK